MAIDFDDALPKISATILSDSPFSEAELNSRSGHDQYFLGNDLRLPLPNAREREAWLNYTHFSILLDRARRQPRLTIVDIDGEKWIEIHRRKGDKWYPDPRVKKEEQPEKKLFETPDPNFNRDHNDFAYGHMVRRQDPNWNDGNPLSAENSERETFHLTNAAPQAEKLNSGPWNNLEDLVLDDLKKRLKIRAVVLTGPVFSDSDPRLHGIFQIPRQFWKLVAWRAGNQLATVAWIQKQTPGTLPTPAAVEIPFDNDKSKNWLVPVKEIESLTGLDLSVYSAADTYALRRQPHIAGGGLSEEPLRLPAKASALLLVDIVPPDDTLPKILKLEPHEIQSRHAAMADREAQILSVEMLSIAGVGDEGSTPFALAQRISKRAYDLIVQHETGDRKYYERVYKKRPVWPQANSGITIGFGYDLGYVPEEEFKHDWAKLSAADRTALAATIGTHGGNRSAEVMRTLLIEVKHIIIEWELAETVFTATTLPKFAALTNGALPNCNLLNGDCFGALVSLTFNRGPSYSHAYNPATDPKDRYREMRAIRAAMQARSFSSIPNEIRAMKRIWVNSAIEQEMNRRRDNEAELFETGTSLG